MLALAMYLIVPAFAAQVGIGVEPTVVDVYMDNNNQRTYLPVKLFNPSDQGMIFRLEAENALKPYLYLSCDPYENVSYWCESREYILAANTPKANAIISKILFVRNAGLDADFESAIYVIGRSAVSINGTVGITPRVMIRITMHQATVVNTTTTTTASTTTTTIPITTTTTTTTMKMLPVNSSVTTTTKPNSVVIVLHNFTTTTVRATATTIAVPEAVQSSVIPVIPEIPIFTYIIILAVLAVLGGAIYIARDRFIIVLVLFVMVMSFMMPVALAFDPDAIITVNVTDAVTTTTTSTTTTTTTSTTTTTTTVPTTTPTLVPTTTTTTLPFPEPLFDMSKNLIVLVGAVSMIFAVASLVIR
jgi:hypothetical protein